MLNKTTAFFENARLLYTTLGIIPLMYGSLGLEYLTGTSFDADDVDILIPEAFVGRRWNELADLLSKNGYLLIDEHEHAFEKDGIHYAYAQIEELESFAGVCVPAIELRIKDGIPFMLLSLRQYLSVYTASARDGYRIHTRNKKDYEKIRYIESELRT